MSISIRPATPSDAEACGRVIFEAFHGIAARHGFPPDFPAPEAGIGLVRSLTTNPSVFGIVAEADGYVLGSNFVSNGDAIRGIGPITVAPQAQGKGVGRRLMQAILDHANGAAGIRLLQDAFNMRSVALYASLGFEVREPVLVITGRPSGEPPTEVSVRPLDEQDIDACESVCLKVHGISRRRELADAIRSLRPLVAERDGRITAYMTAPTFWIANHGVATTDADMKGLILGAAGANEQPLAFLLPTRQTGLFRWCLERGMRAVKPMTLMSIGEYRTPDGAYMPSVFY